MDLGEIKKELALLRREIERLRRPEPELLSVEEVAQMLGLAPKTIRNGLGPRARKPFPIRPVRLGGRVLFRRADIAEFIRSLTPGTSVEL
jgi:predicted DNA-binding transcriptional regulator AlpA